MQMDRTSGQFPPQPWGSTELEGCQLPTLHQPSRLGNKRENLKIRKREKTGHELPLSLAQPTHHQYQIFPLALNQPIQILLSLGNPLTIPH